LDLVLEGDLGGWGRQREDDMEVRHRQQLGLTRGKPLFAFLPLALWAMPVAAGIVGNTDRAAVLALLDVTAKRCRSA
jgi:hypothetical protein